MYKKGGVAVDAASGSIMDAHWPIPAVQMVPVCAVSSLRIYRQQDEQKHGNHANNGNTSDKNVLTGQNVSSALFILGHDGMFSPQRLASATASVRARGMPLVLNDVSEIDETSPSTCFMRGVRTPSYAATVDHNSPVSPCQFNASDVPSVSKSTHLQSGPEAVANVRTASRHNGHNRGLLLIDRSRKRAYPPRSIEIAEAPVMQQVPHTPCLGLPSNPG